MAEESSAYEEWHAVGIAIDSHEWAGEILKDIDPTISEPKFIATLERIQTNAIAIIDKGLQVIVNTYK